MSIDLIKKEDTFLSFNNLILTHYEILGDNDIYFLKIRIKNNNKKINSFTINYNVFGKSYSYDLNISIDNNEEKDILEPINIPLADFEFISFTNIVYDEIDNDEKDNNIDSKEEIIKPKYNIPFISLITSSILSLFILLSRLVFPYVNRYSTDSAKIIYEDSGNANIIEFFKDFYITYKTIYYIKLTIYIIGAIFTLLLIIKAFISYFLKKEIKLKDSRLPLLFSTTIYILCSTYNYSFDIFLILGLTYITYIIFDFLYDYNKTTHSLIRKISKSLLVLLSLMIIIVLKQPIIDNMDLFKLFENVYTNYNGGLIVIAMIVVIINIIIITYLIILLSMLLTSKVDIIEYVLTFVLVIFYVICTYLLKTNKNFNHVENASPVLIILILIMALILIIKELIIRKTINKTI